MMDGSSRSPKRKIAILGGGMGSLTAAFELTATPELRAAHEVTIYQQGWRLGGKCASGRTPDPSHRSEEHGLHVWFGFYENAFSTLRAAYEELGLGPDFPFRTVDDAFTGRNNTPVGNWLDDPDGPWKIQWPIIEGKPGTGQAINEPWSFVLALLEQVVKWFTCFESRLLSLSRNLGAWERLRRGAESLEEEARLRASEVRRVARGAAANVSATVRAAADDLRQRWQGRPFTTQLSPLHLAVAKVKEWRGASSNSTPAFTMAIHGLVTDFRGIFGHHLKRHAVEDGILGRLWTVIDIGLAMLAGLLDPRDNALASGDLSRLDRYDFREWLSAHGATPANVQSIPVRAVYDAFFEYDWGRLDSPNYAAGVAMRVILRVAFGYQGSVLYLPKAGFGEAVVWPLYETLRRRGVHFEFFSKVEKLVLSPDKSEVAAVRLGVQARMVDDKPYAPLFAERISGFYCWPTEPFWDQLVDGAQAKAAGAAFESAWNQWPLAGSKTLLNGTDFDDVVLGISVPAVQDICAELDVNPRWKQMRESIHPVPSQAVQLWLTQDSTALGWPDPPAMDSGPEPVDVWAEMSQILPSETWPDGQPRPASLQYLCGVMDFPQVYAPPADPTIPAQALALVTKNTNNLLANQLWAMWPGAAKKGQPFDWNLLFAPNGSVGPARLGEQFLRANVDPTECCHTSLKGTIELRLKAWESGFTNLWLAGDSIYTGINSACVEGAVTGGKQASRAICGSPLRIVGEDFLGPKLWPPKDVARSGRRSVAALPVYVDHRGMGEQCMIAPGVINDATIHSWVVQANNASMQAVVDKYLNAPTGEAVKYTVVGSHILISFLESPDLTTAGPPYGTMSDREMAFWFVLLAKTRGDPLPRIVLWNPYLTVDSAIAMATGRETWGFNKEDGEVQIPGPDDPPVFVAEAMLFKTLDGKSKGAMGPVVTIRELLGKPVGQPVSVWGSVEEVLANVVGRFLDLHGVAGDPLKELAKLLGLGIDAVEMLARAEMTLANLKQFRDAENPELACYQALVESPCVITKYGGAGITTGEWEVSLTDAASHAFASLFGIASPVKAQLALWIKMTFVAEDGQVLWKAGDSGYPRAREQRHTSPGRSEPGAPNEAPLSDPLPLAGGGR